VSADPAVIAGGVRPPIPIARGPFTRRQREILTAIEREILSAGFRRLRVTDLAGRLGASLTTLYQLAPSKDELVLLVIDRWYQRTGGKAWSLLELEADPIRRIEIWLDTAVQAAHGVTMRFLEDAESHAGVQRLIRSYNDYSIGVLENMIRVGVECGRVDAPNPRLVAEAMDAVVQRLSHTDVLRRSGASDTAAAEVFRHLLLNGLLPRGARSRTRAHEEQ
jgi:AcrR family transcriptional regulator